MYDTALQNWVGLFSLVIIPTYCTVAQIASGPCAVWSYCLLSPRMSAGAPGYWHVYKTASLENYWFVYFTACIRLHLTHWSAGAESNWHAYVGSPSPSNQDPRSVPWLTGPCSRVWVPEGWGSPGDQRWENECWGDQHTLGARWALRGFFFFALCERCFVCRGLKAAGGVEGRDVEKDYHYETAVMLLALWGTAGVSIRSLCCAPCSELAVPTVQRRSFVKSAQLDMLWIDKCWLWTDRRIRLNG